jgi:hypothetical protein
LNERLFAYRKDNPNEPHLRSIRDVAAENYYYAQIKPDGSRDLETLEKLFQQSENRWCEIVAAFERGEQLSNDLTEAFFEFLGALRVRGPASRDAAELALAEQVRVFGQAMEKRGDFGVPPAGLEEALAFENLTISIDPHQSLHLMPYMLQGFSKVLDQVGFSILINYTKTPLITCDNPVIYFDPSLSEENIRPYAIENGPPIEILLPLTPKLLLVGHSDWAGPYSHRNLRYRTCSNPQIIKRANRYIARFAYREVFASTRTHDALVAKWADQSPIVRNSQLKTSAGTAIITQWIFGRRPVKPKWKSTTPPSE